MFREQHINMVSYQEGYISEILPIVKHFCEKGLTVIVEEEPTIARGE